MSQFNRAVIDNKYVKIFFVVVFVLVAALLIKSPKAYAAYDGARLIDNQVFLDANSMNATQIQQFLVDKGAGLASRTFVLTCGAPSDTATMNAYAAISAPCGQTIPASSIIYYAAQVYGVNPRVILATMQKEQSLTTATNPTDWQINQAMGYGCPDSGGCSGASNFFYQIDNGTWALRYHYERANRNNTWWNNGNNVCGGSSTYRSAGLYAGATVTFKDDNGVSYATLTLANAATAAFYCYTPHTYNNPQGLYGLPAMGTVGMYYSGSYNFVLWFVRWFGGTTIADFVADFQDVQNYTNSSKTTAVAADRLRPEQKTYMVLRFKNNGNSIWQKTGIGAVRLATYPVGSAFCDSTWISCNRPAELIETSVAPGSTGTFEFWYSAPVVSVYTVFTTQFGVVAETVANMNGIKQTQTTAVEKPEYIARYVDVSNYTDSTKTTGVPANIMNPRDSTYMQLRFRNEGNTTWRKNGSGAVRLMTAGASTFCDTKWLSCERPSALIEEVVQPGETGTFEFWYTAPFTQQASVFSTTFGVVSEAVSIMAGTKQIQTTTVRNTNYSADYVDVNNYIDATKTSQIPANTLNTGQKTYMSLRFKNTSNYTWRNTGWGIVRLYTTNGPSVFCDTTWVTCNRPADLKEASVAPGGTGTFEFWYTAPTLSATATYTTSFGLVSDFLSQLQGTKQIQTTTVIK